MEKKMDNEMETGVMKGIIGSVVFYLRILRYPIKARAIAGRDSFPGAWCSFVLAIGVCDGRL